MMYDLVMVAALVVLTWQSPEQQGEPHKKFVDAKKVVVAYEQSHNECQRLKKDAKEMASKLEETISQEFFVTKDGGQGLVVGSMKYYCIPTK